MNRLKTCMAAASAMACLVAPASAALTGNSLTSNSLTSNGLGVYALNGVRADNIVLAKSLAPANGSVASQTSGNLPAVQHGAGSFLNPNMGNLPAVQKSQSSAAGKKSNGLPSVQQGTGSDAGVGPSRPTPLPRR